jgi:hypothetical protein
MCQDFFYSRSGQSANLTCKLQDLRDMMLRGYESFNKFLHSDEKIASNILADRHEETGNQPLVRQMRTAKDQLIAEVRQRWAEKHAARAPAEERCGPE